MEEIMLLLKMILYKIFKDAPEVVDETFQLINSFNAGTTPRSYANILQNICRLMQDALPPRILLYLLNLVHRSPPERKTFLIKKLPLTYDRLIPSNKPAVLLNFLKNLKCDRRNHQETERAQETNNGEDHSKKNEESKERSANEELRKKQTEDPVKESPIDKQDDGIQDTTQQMTYDICENFKSKRKVADQVIVMSDDENDEITDTAEGKYVIHSFQVQINDKKSRDDDIVIIETDAEQDEMDDNVKTQTQAVYLHNDKIRDENVTGKIKETEEIKSQKEQENEAIKEGPTKAHNEVENFVIKKEDNAKFPKRLQDLCANFVVHNECNLKGYYKKQEQKATTMSYKEHGKRLQQCYKVVRHTTKKLKLLKQIENNDVLPGSIIHENEILLKSHCLYPLLKEGDSGVLDESNNDFFQKWLHYKDNDK